MDLRQRFDATERFYLYGATPAAEGVVDLLGKHGKEIAGFVDRDQEKQLKSFLGYSVFSPDALFEEKGDNAGIIIVSAYQQEIARFLAESTISVDAIFPLLDGMFLPTYGDHFAESAVLDRILSELQDLEEKNYFSTWREFKRTGNLAELKAMKSIESQYNHKAWFSGISPGGAAIDVGAFDGATSIDLAKTGAFSKVIAIEPFEANFKAMQSRFNAADTKVELHAMKIALGASKATIHQNTEDVSSRSRIETQHTDIGAQSEQIDIVPLDSLNIEDVSLLKVDVEGFEMDFLAGAVETLRTNRPHLAISAYHHKDHPAAIAQFLYDEFENVTIRVGHHPTAVYELEYYVSFN